MNTFKTSPGRPPLHPPRLSKQKRARHNGHTLRYPYSNCKNFSSLFHQHDLLRLLRHFLYRPMTAKPLLLILDRRGVKRSRVAFLALQID